MMNKESYHRTYPACKEPSWNWKPIKNTINGNLIACPHCGVVVVK